MRTLFSLLFLSLTAIPSSAADDPTSQCQFRAFERDGCSYVQQLQEVSSGKHGENAAVLSAVGMLAASTKNMSFNAMVAAGVKALDDQKRLQAALLDETQPIIARRISEALSDGLGKKGSIESAEALLEREIIRSGANNGGLAAELGPILERQMKALGFDLEPKLKQQFIAKAARDVSETYQRVLRDITAKHKKNAGSTVYQNGKEIVLDGDPFVDALDKLITKHKDVLGRMTPVSELAKSGSSSGKVAALVADVSNQDLAALGKDFSQKIMKKMISVGEDGVPPLARTVRLDILDSFAYRKFLTSVAMRAGGQIAGVANTLGTPVGREAATREIRTVSQSGIARETKDRMMETLLNVRNSLTNAQAKSGAELLEAAERKIAGKSLYALGPLAIVIDEMGFHPEKMGGPSRESLVEGAKDNPRILWDSSASDFRKFAGVKSPEALCKMLDHESALSDKLRESVRNMGWLLKKFDEGKNIACGSLNSKHIRTGRSAPPSAGGAAR